MTQDKRTLYVGKHRGFAFVDFEEGQDAYQAMDNLNAAEFFGRVMKINFAKPDSMSSRPVWEHSDYHIKDVPEAQEAQEEQKQEGETVAAMDEEAS